jgi:hypothetical protein
MMGECLVMYGFGSFGIAAESTLVLRLATGFLLLTEAGAVAKGGPEKE